MNAAFITRHFGDRAVKKLADQGIDVLGLEQAQGGPMYRVLHADGREVVVPFLEVTELLGW